MDTKLSWDCFIVHSIEEGEEVDGANKIVTQNSAKLRLVTGKKGEKGRKIRILS